MDLAQFWADHQAALSVVIFAVVNLVIELNPKLASNSVFSLLWNLLKMVLPKKDESKPQ